jgi:uncharacterized membrane protein required for colicin V production
MVIDIVIIILLIQMLALGVYLGAVKIFLSVISIFIGSLVATNMYVLISRNLQISNWSVMFLFASILFVVTSLIFLTGYFLSKIIRAFLLNPVDRILGAATMILIAIYIVASLLKVLPQVSPASHIDIQRYTKTSHILPYFLKVEKKFLGDISEVVLRKTAIFYPNYSQKSHL